jgi:hypothetical protein
LTAADVVGYPRLVAADEEGILERLRVLRRELADPAIKKHQGRIVRIIGGFWGRRIRCAWPSSSLRENVERPPGIAT